LALKRAPLNKTLHLVSLGCTKNLVDSEVMLGRLRDYDITDTPETADVIIVNTCGFIDAAKEESIHTLLTLHKQRKPDSLLVMSGCLSERYKDELHAQMPEIDIFTGVGDYAQIDALIERRESLFTPEVYLVDEQASRIVTGSRYHAYIKIAEGCNQHCAFCAIPTFKGTLHSRTLDSIATEVGRHVAEGYWDFTFVSQDSSSYGRDLGIKDGLIDLIARIEQIEGVRSARILYLYPSTTSLALIDTIAESKRFQTYYDMPIQHIDDAMLKTMKRGFGESQTMRLLAHMRSKPDAFVRTSLIAGHPGEDEEMFLKLCDFMATFGFDRFNTFAYSNEENTAAYTMPQLPEALIASRSQALGEIAEQSTEASMRKLVGTTLTVVINAQSQEHELLLSARPLLWAPDIDGEILINDTSDLPVSHGACFEAKVTEYTGGHLLATLLARLD
jgi:ribosomal protein S12 methylthiotransferase